MRKICPLFFASADSEIEFECRPDVCAWAYNGKCAVRLLACCLAELAEYGITVRPETEDDQ